jgi:hypothetical protein
LFCTAKIKVSPLKGSILINSCIITFDVTYCSLFSGFW